MEHERSYKKSASDIFGQENQVITVTQDLFLANSRNQSNFIKLLCSKLGESGVVTSTAEGDADTLIVQTALAMVGHERNQVIVVGEDVDLLVLLIALSVNDRPNLFLFKLGRRLYQTGYITFYRYKIQTHS